MERIESLIAKLSEQFSAGAESAQLLATLAQLQNELTQSQPRAPRTLGTSKVVVTMPSGMSNFPPEYEPYLPRTKQVEEPIQEAEQPVVAVRNSASIVHDNGQLDMAFDPMLEIPTLSHQVQEPASRNDIGKIGEPESLNEKLKQIKTELFEVLKETPIKDLRKAIGINDRFLFIDDLFRGDEAMYERSIKTINSFNMHAEAEYWISRELKVKLGWPTDHKTAQHFDQLVKRRFS